MNTETTHYKTLIEDYLARTPDDIVATFTQTLAERPGVVAVLFYGNLLRDRNAGGLLDFYVLTESHRHYHGTGFSAFFNWLLPPNVYFDEKQDTSGATLHAKVAVMTLETFSSRMNRHSFDTTLWARFAQPVILGFSRDATVRKDVTAAIIAAHEAAAWWAARFSPDNSSGPDVWAGLFQKTYGAELRVETSARAATIVDNAPELYTALYDNLIKGTAITSTQNRDALRAWSRRRQFGKALNIMRLIKAAFTFRGGINYALSKVERHSGRPVILRPWERRFPWLAAPFVLLRLIRERRLR